MGCEMISEKVKVHVFHVQNDEYQVKCKRNTQVQNYSELLDFFSRMCLQRILVVSISILYTEMYTNKRVNGP